MTFDNIEEIAEVLVLLPVGVLAVSALGLVLAGPLAILCALVAHQNNLDWRTYAWAGAKCSALLILPAIHLLISLAFGKVPFPRVVIVSVYSVVYLLWMGSIVINAIAMMLFFADLLLYHNYSLGPTIILATMFGIVLPINLYSWSTSIRDMRTLTNANHLWRASASPLLLAERYSRPFGWTILWSLTILLMTLIAGLLGFVGT